MFARTLAALVLVSTLPLAAQAPPAPQTARQALLEMLLSPAPGAFEKHLPEITRKKLLASEHATELNQFRAMSALATMDPQRFHAYETGPILLSFEPPQQDMKFEITVLRDDLTADGDEIELTFHSFKGTQAPESHISPRLTLHMNQENNVWRLREIGFSVTVPLDDPKLLDAFLQKPPATATASGTSTISSTRAGNEARAVADLRTVVSAQTTYAGLHPQIGFASSLSELNSDLVGPPSDQRPLIDVALSTGMKNGYVFSLTGGLGVPVRTYTVVARPMGKRPGRTFCTDQGGVIRSVAAGSGEDCLTAGKPLQ